MEFRKLIPGIALPEMSQKEYGLSHQVYNLMRVTSIVCWGGGGGLKSQNHPFPKIIHLESSVSETKGRKGVKVYIF